jgi:hypothetical protein
MKALEGSKTAPRSGCSTRLFLRVLNPCESDVMQEKENSRNSAAAIINCFRCQPEKGLCKCVDFISRFEATGIETIVLPPFVLDVCPFKNDFIRIVKDKFPKAEFGKKDGPNPLVIPSDLFLAMVKRILAQLAIHRTHLAG